MTKTLTVVVVIQLKLHKLHEELPTQFIGLRAFIKLRLNPVAGYRYVCYGIASGIGHKVVGRLLLATSYYVPTYSDCKPFTCTAIHRSFSNAFSVPR